MAQYILEHESEAKRLEFQATIPQYSLENELKYFLPFTGSKILDIGCGTGLLSRYLAEKFSEVQIDACDLSELRLAEAKKLCRLPAHHKINFFPANFDQLDIEDNTYDFVVIRYVLEHLNNPLRAISEARRILRPGGSLYVIDFDGIFLNLFSDNEELTQYLKKIESNFAGDLRIGHKIPTYLKKNNFSQINYHVDVMQFKGHETELELRNNQERCRNCFNEFSRILGGSEIADRFVKLYLDESVKEGNVLCFNKFIVTAKK
ncbi:MAG: methyltransferase domain-containing protein [Bacteriovorax sp.]|nr:methyltransferase domain-containing protein [Bacteriovorax sp.]